MIHSQRLLLLFFLWTGLLHADDKIIYSVNFKKPDTYKVSGGVINAGYWEVRNDSSIFTSGNWLCNEKGNFRYKVSIELTADGKLNNTDQAIIYVMKNEAIAKSFVVKGGDVGSAKKFEYEIDQENAPVVKVNIVLKSFGADRARRINDQSVSITAISKDDDPEFKVTKQSTTTLLSWKKKTNENNNYFIIERSINGTDFSQAGLVKADRNNVVSRYSFVDRTDGDIKYYYRIKVKSFDGDETQFGEILKSGIDSDVANSSN